MSAARLAPTPEWGHPSSTVTHRLVFLHGGQNGLEVERPQGTRVDHLGAHAVLGGERGGGALGGEGHSGDPTMVTSEPRGRERAQPEVDEVLVDRRGPRGATRRGTRLDEDHGVLIADGGLEQAVGIGGGRGDGDEQPGDVQEDRLEAVGYVARPVAGALGHAHDEGRATPARRTCSRWGGVIRSGRRRAARS